ncbi:MAG: NUDIX hydrolase [Pseudomonadota bacterium]
MTEAFLGAKVAILVGDRVVTILRDDTPTIPWPNTWDLPGGGREGTETPEETLRREVREELGLNLPRDALRWSLVETPKDAPVWFFAAEWSGFDASAVRFGDEGQEWRLAPIDWFLSREDAVPNLQRRLGLYLKERGSLGR